MSDSIIRKLYFSLLLNLQLLDRVWCIINSNVRMAQQNIWKRQIQQNRGRTQKQQTTPRSQIDTSSPINQFMKNNNNSTASPPWAKNNAANSSPNQPPWAKNNTPSPESSSNTPSWMANRAKQPQNVVNAPKQAVSNAPWMKNSTNQGNLPPWAKNNAQNEDNSKPQQTSSQPSWMKNNAPTTSANSNQPAWMKVSAQSNNQAPWMKKTESPTANSGSNVPAWAKNAGRAQSPSQQDINASKPAENKPSWVTKAQQNISKGETPGPQMAKRDSKEGVSSTPWAKNSDDSPQVKRNSWKRQQSQQIQKQKKQLQEKIKQQEDQEKEKKRLEKEEKSMMRQLEQMGVEDEQSAQREKFDLQEELRKEQERQEQQRKKKEEEEIKQKERLEEQQKQKQRQQELQKQKSLQQQDKKQPQPTKPKKKPSSSSRRKKSVLQSSKISHISSIKGFENVNAVSSQDPQLPQKLYHKYLRLINQQTLEFDYKKKIQLQKGLYRLQLESRKQCEQQLVRLFASKKITNRKRKYIFSNSMQIQYALVEGHNSETGLQFETNEVEELRIRFLQYQLLSRCVFSLIKKKVNLHLRVPLLNYAEHKGVSFLVEHVCQELVDIIEIEIGMFQEIANEVLVFEKELELSHEGRDDLPRIAKQQLMVKKVSIYGQDYYILYLKNQQKSLRHKQPPQKQGNVLSQLMPKYGHLNDLSVLQHLIGHNNLLPYLQQPLEISKTAYQQLQKVISPALRGILHGCCLARAIKVVYSSCQGEVDEQSFFKLVLEGNKQMWDMIVAAGSPDRQLPKPITLAYLEKMSSVKFNFIPKMIPPRKKHQLVNNVKPVVFIQRHDYELFQFIKNLERYVEEDKEDLVEQSLSCARQLWEDLKQDEDNSNEFNFLKLKSEVSYLLYKQREAEAAEFIEQARGQVEPYALENIPIFLLALKIYVARDMELALLKTLSQMLPILQFYFGSESMIHASIYTIVANFYSKKTDEDEHIRSQKVVTFYEHALNIALKLYGEKGIEVADIYLGRASAFCNLALFQNFHKDMQQALKIYKGHSKSAPKIAQCTHLTGRVKCLEGQLEEGIQLMETSSQQWMKMYNHVESLHILFELLPFLENKQNQLESTIQRIVEICFCYKAIWAFRRIVTIVLDRELNCYTSLTIQHLQQLFHPLEPEDRTNQQILIDLEQEIKGFTSFIQIVRWALSIIAGKMASRRQATGDYEKAHTIIHEIFLFYGKNQPMLMDSKDMGSEIL